MPPPPPPPLPTSPRRPRHTRSPTLSVAACLLLTAGAVPTTPAPVPATPPSPNATRPPTPLDRDCAFHFGPSCAGSALFWDGRAHQDPVGASAGRRRSVGSEGRHPSVGSEGRNISGEGRRRSARGDGANWVADGDRLGRSRGSEWDRRPVGTGRDRPFDGAARRRLQPGKLPPGWVPLKPLEQEGNRTWVICANRAAAYSAAWLAPKALLVRGVCVPEAGRVGEVPGSGGVCGRRGVRRVCTLVAISTTPAAWRCV